VVDFSTVSSVRRSTETREAKGGTGNRAGSLPRQKSLTNWLERRQFGALGIFWRPPKRLWTRNQNQAQARHPEDEQAEVSLGREVKTEIPVEAFY
jgi:hypothetical protein